MARHRSIDIKPSITRNPFGFRKDIHENLFAVSLPYLVVFDIARATRARHARAHNAKTSSSLPPELEKRGERKFVMEDEPCISSDPEGGGPNEAKDDDPILATADEDRNGDAAVQQNTAIDPDNEVQVNKELVDTDTVLDIAEARKSPAGSGSDAVVQKHVRPPSTGTSSGPGFDMGLASYTAQQFPGTYNEGGADGEERPSSSGPHNGGGPAVSVMDRNEGENVCFETEDIGIVHRSAMDEGFGYGGGVGGVDAAARPTRPKVSVAGDGEDYQDGGRGDRGGDGTSGKVFENSRREGGDNFVGQGGGRRMFDGSRVAEPDDIQVVHAGEGADLIAGVDDLPVFANEQSKALNDEIKVRRGYG